ncbi:iron-sulfur cluster repair di-iron protein [Gelidibacter salicanalis]|uniref:Iron-sulfur cluster repair di-iron protein n=1 Tax=Gelidibacter salicanalis TaxID=291193 RepID=A0A934KV90_9FLAO|nr:iron-sulfur cluster repair di-iron protein [Gelidibacter salicanalis]MBJ7881966.1 iron-sulfur cluster repair di-iron protein [Gelidibacter salicanalis]
METTLENILNVTLLEPQQKHPTIFNRFNELKEGESLIIHNDHDPKPLYYQLLGQKGNIFTWEYLEEGPAWWKIRIRKRVSGENEETLGALAAKDLRKAEVFKKYGLDFCCGGKKTVQEACAEKGLDLTKVEQELQQIDKVPSSRPMPYDEWELDFLSDYIVNVHHRYVRKNLPDLTAYAEKVMEVHGERHPELVEIKNLVKDVGADMLAHMEKEEQRLFPLINSMIKGSKETPSQKTLSSKEFQNFITHHEAEHLSVGNEMDDIRKLTNNYTLPEDACASYTLLYRLLDEFEEDLHLHIHLENNILFPKAIKLEIQLQQSDETH